MKFTSEIQALINSPEDLENLYQMARQSNEEPEFRSDLQELYEKSPENLGLSIWHARFQQAPLPKAKRAINWGLAVILGIITGLILWGLSDPALVFSANNNMPYIALLWAPVAAIFTMG